jgi:hypothetical protein
MWPLGDLLERFVIYVYIPRADESARHTEGKNKFMLDSVVIQVARIIT